MRVLPVVLVPQRRRLSACAAIGRIGDIFFENIEQVAAHVPYMGSIGK